MVKDGEAQADEQLKKLFKNKPEKLVVTVDHYVDSSIVIKIVIKIVENCYQHW